LLNMFDSDGYQKRGQYEKIDHNHGRYLLGNFRIRE
jgi:hypothetical protein